MKTQRLSPPSYILSPPNPSVSTRFFAPISSPPHLPITNLAFIRNLNHRFSISLKMVPISHLSSTRHGGLLVRARCGGKEVDDGLYMRRCVEVARKAIGCTSPNPMVGCIIVRDGLVVGEGFHPKAGQPHAEVFALRDAGELAEGATAYVSLEPCNHYGRTPPCTEALIKAKVKRVVVGMVDPNPIVASKGVDRLRDAGIDVTVGVEEEMCKKLNEAYIHRMLTGKPLLTLRYSLSVNGCFLDQLGEGVSESGGYYSKLLQEYDGVILSSSFTEKLTSLASKESGANQPIQIIVANSPQQLPIYVPNLTEEAASKVVLFTDKETSAKSDRGEAGIETVVLDRMNLDSVLENCKQRGLCSVLLDLRGDVGDLEVLLREGIKQELLQKIVVEVLPIWNISNTENPLASLNWLANNLKVKNLLSRISGKSIVVEGYLKC